MNRLTGILLIAVSAASFGTLGIFGNFAYAEGVDTFTVLFLRFGLAASFMTIVLILRKEPFPRGRILAQLIGMGGLGYGIQSFMYMTAIKYASPGLVALLLYLYPFFVAILSMIFLNEKLSRIKAIALVLALVGAALTVGPLSGQLIGAVLAITGALVYSIYIIVGSHVMRQVSAIQSSTVIFASAGAVYGALIFVNGASFPSTQAGWLAIAGIVFISTIIPVVTFLAGLERVGPINAAMLSTLEPVVTVLLAAWLFGDKLMPIVLVGGVMILVAVLILTRAEMQGNHT